MACPVCLTVGVLAPFTGAWTLFVQDRKFRRLWWTLLLLLLALWAAYFLWSDRSTLVRAPLDVLSTVFVVGMLLRLLRLIFHHGKVPPGTRTVQSLLRITAPYMMSRVTVMLKSYLLTLLLVQASGYASFPTVWYSAGVVALIGWWGWLWLWMHGLESSSARLLAHSRLLSWLKPKQPSSTSEPKGGCPLGFGKAAQN